MGFQQLQTLPARLGNIPEIFHPTNIPAPPVYNTDAAVAPLLKLAEYLSPDARARRKAAVAKAAYDYWMYAPGGQAYKNVTWLNEQRGRERQIKTLQIDALNRRKIGRPYTAEEMDAFRRMGIIPPASAPVTSVRRRQEFESSPSLDDVSVSDDTEEETTE